MNKRIQMKICIHSVVIIFQYRKYFILAFPVTLFVACLQKFLITLILNYFFLIISRKNN